MDIEINIEALYPLTPLSAISHEPTPAKYYVVRTASKAYHEFNKQSVPWRRRRIFINYRGKGAEYANEGTSEITGGGLKGLSQNLGAS